MHNQQLRHTETTESIYNMFKSALARKKFGDKVSVVAKLIRQGRNQNDYDWADIISFESGSDAKFFWTLVAEELDEYA